MKKNVMLSLSFLLLLISTGCIILSDGDQAFGFRTSWEFYSEENEAADEKPANSEFRLHPMLLDKLLSPAEEDNDSDGTGSTD